jgi:hypothetical protein
MELEGTKWEVTRTQERCIAVNERAAESPLPGYLSIMVKIPFFRKGCAIPPLGGLPSRTTDFPDFDDDRVQSNCGQPQF